MECVVLSVRAGGVIEVDASTLFRVTVNGEIRQELLKKAEAEEWVEIYNGGKPDGPAAMACYADPQLASS